MNEFRIQYKVSYLELPSSSSSLVVSPSPSPSQTVNESALKNYLHRSDDISYAENCNKLFALNLFPCKLDKNRYRPEFIYLSSIITAYRVQNFILLSEIKQFNESITKSNEVIHSLSESHGNNIGIDTDVLHGSLQRLDTNVALQAIEANKIEIKSKIKAHNGELACLTQYAYMLSVPYIQRAWRGALGRWKSNTIRMRILQLAIEAAVLTLQCYFRRKTTQDQFSTLLFHHRERNKSNFIILLQKMLRGWTKWHKYQPIKIARYQQRVNHAATMFQAVIRGFIYRRRLLKDVFDKSALRTQLSQNWAAVSIQRIVRGFVARHTVIKSFIARRQLNPKLIRLTEKYLQKGDLWSFIYEIGDEMRILQEKLEENEWREDHMASTFVSKVLVRRQTDFDSAWDVFSRTISQGMRGEGGGGGGGVTRAIAGDEAEGFLSAISAHNEKKETSYFGGYDGTDINSKMYRSGPTPISAAANTIGIASRTSVPGPLARRAITASVREKVHSSQQLQVKKRTKASEISIAEISRQYGGVSGVTQTGNSRANKSTVHSTVRAAKGSSRSSPPSNPRQLLQEDWLSEALPDISTNSEFPSPGKFSRNTMLTPIGSSVSTRGAGSGASRSRAVATPFSPHAAQTQASSSRRDSSPLKSAMMQSRGERAGPRRRLPRVATLPPSVDAGESFLVDIPSGLEDRVERLVRAAALRVYVPPFFQTHNTSVKEAFAIYTSMPSCLAKVRYEQECNRWCHDLVGQLISSGSRFIKDLLPASKLRLILKSFGACEDLIWKCNDIALVLKRMGQVPMGKLHTPSANTSSELMLHVAQAAVVSPSSPPKSPTKVTFSADLAENLDGRISRQFRPSSSLQTNQEDDRGGGDDMLSSTPSTPISSLPVSNTLHGVNMLNDLEATKPYQMLDVFVSSGSWSHLKAPLEDLFLHAAFVVCSVVDIADGEEDRIVESAQDEAPQMGQETYLKYATHLLAMSTDEERRHVTQHRYRKALLLCTPYVARLRQDGCESVFDLTKYDLQSLSMPHALATQVDAFISTAIARSAHSKKAFLSYENLDIKAREVSVPLLFDPRFQRSPFDPFGRPPRAATLREMVRNKLTQVPVEISEGSEYSEVPYGLWDQLLQDSDVFARQHIEGEGAIARDHLKIKSAEGIALFKCQYPECGLCFHRLLNLKKHEKMHSFGAYAKYKGDPQLFYDDDTEEYLHEAETHDLARTTLSPLVLSELMHVGLGASKQVVDVDS